MHEIAATVGSSAIIFIGIISGILFNQRALDKLELRMDARFDQVDARIDRIEARMDRLEARIDRIEGDLREFFRSIGAVEKAIDVLEKRA